jgi:hypothetical protein
MKISASSKNAQRTQHYVLQPSLHPHGWKLEVKEGTGPLLYTIFRRPTTPPTFKVHSSKPSKAESLRIKSKLMEDVVHYTLLEGTQEQLSIRTISNSPLVSVRDQQRKTIARFSPISPEIVLLRTHTGSVARLRIKERAAPLKVQIECEAKPGVEWLYAIILYIIARIESPKPIPQQEEDQVEEADTSIENNNQ